MAAKLKGKLSSAFPRAKELLAHSFRMNSWKLNRCIAPGENCPNQAIKSHSIQNARVLDLLCCDGHVKMIRHEMSREALTLDFRDVGRNEASTFGGFCSLHDRILFRAIDLAPVDPSDPEQLFLLAYRSIAQELHASTEAAVKVQSTYQKRVELGLDKGSEPEPAGMLALERMVVALKTHFYKADLDAKLSVKDFSSLQHVAFHIEHSMPALAISALFDIQQRVHEEDSPRIAINIFPISTGQSFVLFSFTPLDAPRAREYLQQIESSTGDYQKYLLSKLILMHCQNFVVSPALFDTWSSRKVDCICQFSLDTVRYDKAVEDHDLYLF